MKNKHFQRSAIAAACVALVSGSALAQDGAASGQQLETVQVVGNWLGSGQKSVKNFGGARTVVKREEIQDSGAASISDVLRTVPGVQITNNSSSGGSAISLNIGVRGLDGRYSPRSTVLLDGIPLAVAPYGQPQLSFAPVSLANIDSIDVVRGGGAVRYGPQNVGGIINFKTRAVPMGDFKGDASVRYNYFDGGNHNTQTSAFAGGGDGDGLGMALMYSGVAGRGYREHSKEQVHDVALKFRYAIDARSELNAKFSYFDAESDLPGGLTSAQFAANPRQSFRNSDKWNGRRKGLDLGYLNTLSATQEVEVRAFYNDSSRASLLANAQDKDVSSLSRQPRDYEVAGIEPRFTQRLNWGAVRHDVTVGYRFLNESAKEAAVSVKIGGTAPTTTRRSENSTKAHSLYVDDQIAYGQWRVTPGVRFEHIKMDRENKLTPFTEEISNHKALPSLNVSYLLSKELILYGNYNSSFGSIQHLQLNLQDSADALKPETAKTQELGARYSGKQWQLEATAFNLDFSNQIQFVNASPVFYKNLGKTRHRGLESRAEYAFDGAGKLSGLSAYATWAYTQAELRQGAHAGNDVPFYSRNVDTQGLKFKRGAWTVDLHTTHQSKQYSDEKNTVAESADGQVGIIPSYRLWNANVSWDVAGMPGTEIQLGVNNLANKTFFTRTTDSNLGILPGAGRMAYIQLRTGF
ncbi:TonB-dependent siderophore receptor [Pseudoduganella sp. DS3]|uniref:TonB-dependent siderophore receptor n=1 Tax=Pseudoduganella guangdongensis TaxID=2692179 RepID=A0A6N9HLU7_9BURK|nr:TonB-dependent siderophore receptor [Pseudoduganella guangdongensis]MYN04641.1 TonB-dependent siderophore receptor [Pseudoduganella guangdongensis]